MSHGSVADELGVRPGDIIDSVNGEHNATTIEVIILTVIAVIVLCCFVSYKWIENLRLMFMILITHIYYSCCCYQLENLLMRICESHLDEGGVIGSCVDIPVSLFLLCLTAVYFYIYCKRPYVYL